MSGFETIEFMLQCLLMMAVAIMFLFVPVAIFVSIQEEYKKRAYNELRDDWLDDSPGG